MRALLQRKCGCAGACGSCREKRSLHRSAIDARTADAIPRSVDRVLASSGAPLDASVRQTFEPRFGHDFSSVRVHTDATAALSASDVHARAWTVGDHIAFGAGHGPNDRALLAHELTHVVQQSSMPRASSPTIGAANDPAEREADAAASAVMSGHNAPFVSQGGTAIRRQSEGLDSLIHDPWPEKTEAAEIRRRHPAGRSLSPAELTAATTATGITAPTASAVPANLNPIFILHDTASDYSVAQVNTEATRIGAQGLGVQAMVPNPEGGTDPGIVNTRPFHQRKRPSATSYEQANDLIDLEPRKKLLREVWRLVNKTEREAVLDLELAEFAYGEKPTKGIRAGVIQYLGTNMSEEDAKKLTDGSRTTAQWTVESLCQRVSAGTAEKMTSSKADAETLTKDCTKLGDWFAERSDRIQSIAGVEIVQVSKDSDIPNPPYSPKQYEDVATMYVRAALAALRFPYVTTHYNIDKNIPGDHHYDPRCYNVHHLYALIAGKFAHGADTIYGIDPKYGSKKEHNVWWSKGPCHGDPPA
jgi:hypothetical protein